MSAPLVAGLLTRWGTSIRRKSEADAKICCWQFKFVLSILQHWEVLNHACEIKWHLWNSVLRRDTKGARSQHMEWVWSDWDIRTFKVHQSDYTWGSRLDRLVSWKHASIEFKSNNSIAASVYNITISLRYSGIFSCRASRAAQQLIPVCRD